MLIFSKFNIYKVWLLYTKWNVFYVMCPQERLLALKRSMSFMQDMDYSQQAAILGDEDLAEEAPPPEIIPLPVESAKKSKKQPVKDLKEAIKYAK